jgi:hypothetical protein
VNGYPGGRVHGALDSLSGGRLSADAVFRREERRQANSVCAVQKVDRTAPVWHNTGVIGDESNSLTAYEMDGIGEQDFDAESDAILRL